ncbi:MAG: AgmX/PglI C-terminal domain-containing protein [Pseudomonadota bacterium]|nr:AgmX/PglI C-terminal domain-containing protein [Pseudomonadota bacterium]
MSATAPQTAQKPLPKVLRIGMAQDQKIVQEKVLKVGETVTIGDNPRNSFVLTGTKLPSRFELFIAKGDSYVLSVPDWVEGKISWKDGIRGLDEIRQRGEAVKRGDLYFYQLNENVRGKVTIGSSTILFQFVPAPPEPVRAVSAADFRPRLLDEDDPLFHGLLGVFSLVAAAFMAWVYTTPPREHVDLDALKDALSLVVERKIDKIEIVQAVPTTEAEGPKPEVKADKPVEKEPKADTRPDTPQPASKDSVAKKSLLLQMIGTSGNANGNDVVADILGDDAASMAGLDRALAGVSGVEQADAGNVGVKSGGANGRTDATVGVGIATGGNSTVGTGTAKVTVKAKVDMGTADADVESGDSGNIASVVKKSQGRIQTCLETSLKANPSVNGRVSVGWTINAGKVTEAHLVKNSTGDDTLGQCIVKSVRQFRFDETLTAEVQEFPWVMSGQ